MTAFIFASVVSKCHLHIILVLIFKFSSYIFKVSIMLRDHLDLLLNATYQHSDELFPDPCDVYLQPLTVNPSKVLQHKQLNARKSLGRKYLQLRKRYMERTALRNMLRKRLYPDNPLIIGGIKERTHPSSVKLMNSSHHSPQTNAGYVRQDRDGNVFQY